MVCRGYHGGKRDSVGKYWHCTTKTFRDRIRIFGLVRRHVQVSALPKRHGSTSEKHGTKHYEYFSVKSWSIELEIVYKKHGVATILSMVLLQIVSLRRTQL